MDNSMLEDMLKSNDFGPSDLSYALLIDIYKRASAELLKDEMNVQNLNQLMKCAININNIFQAQKQ